MKLLSVEIQNIGILEYVKFDINKALIIFFGEPMKGKTTILNSIVLAAGGSFSNDILRHGTNEGFVNVMCSNGYFKRKFKRKKDGDIRAEKIECVLDGEIQTKPTEALKQFLNPFLLDQDFFIKKKSLERQRYFAEILDINTDEYKKKIKDIDEKARDLRSKIKGYGEIDITPVEKVDVDMLREKKKSIESMYETKVVLVNRENEEIGKQNDKYSEISDKIEVNLVKIRALYVQIEEAKNRIECFKKDNLELTEKQKTLSTRNFLNLPEKPDTSEIEEQIAQAYAKQVRREQYLKNMMRIKERENDEKKLAELGQTKKNEEAEMMKGLAIVANQSGIPGLEFDKDANAIFEGSALDMLSHSQIMRLSSLLSAKYPKNFGIELLDRGESIFAGRDKWKTVDMFIKRAIEEDKTFLTTIVGEKPAQVPEDVGVWVVDGGTIK